MGNVLMPASRVKVRGGHFAPFLVPSLLLIAIASACTRPNSSFVNRYVGRTNDANVVYRSTQNTGPIVPVSNSAFSVVRVQHGKGEFTSAETTASPFNDIFDKVGKVNLEETPDVLNVTPMIRLDRDGGFLIADKGEQQIRRYNSAGRLQWHFGKRGGGPGEFSVPTVALRLDTTLVMVMDASARRAVVWNERTRQVVRTLANPLQSVEDVDVVNDTTVLYSSRPSPAADAGSTRFALHLVDPRSGQIRSSFLEPVVTEQNSRALALAGWSSSLIWRDTIASVLSLSDTVYLSSARGSQLARIPLPTERFIPLAKGSRLPNGGINLLTISLSTDVHRLSSGTLVVQFQELVNNVPRFHLVAVALSGKKVFEVDESPRLWAIGPNDVFYFADPDAITPNVILTARLKRQ